MARSSKRRSKRSSPRVTRSTSRTIIKSAGNSSAVWLGALALAGVAAVGTAVYLTERKASASPAPAPGTTPTPTPGTTPVAPAPSLPASGDVYTSLTPAQQAATLAALTPYAAAGATPLTDASNRAVAVANFQLSYDTKYPTATQLQQGGILDTATYIALMGG